MGGRVAEQYDEGRSYPGATKGNSNGDGGHGSNAGDEDGWSSVKGGNGYKQNGYGGYDGGSYGRPGGFVEGQEAPETTTVVVEVV